MISERAPAKINLYLHVGPRRADGLHELASLFAFAGGGDVVSAAPAADLSLQVSGPFAGALAGYPPADNLVLRAARALKREAGVSAGAALRLDKRLPVAAGIGGGSADAAAALRALVRLWRLDIGAARLSRLAFALGADVPACLARAPVNVSGAGDVIAAGPKLPPVWAVLINPGVEMPTGPVFRDFDAANPAPPRPRAPLRRLIATPGALAAFLSQTRNDLQPYAEGRESVIAETCDFLACCPGSLAARMSGSGATVFGLFASPAAAMRAARRGSARGWWSMAAPLAAGAASTGDHGGS